MGDPYLIHQLREACSEFDDTPHSMLASGLACAVAHARRLWYAFI